MLCLIHLRKQDKHVTLCSPRGYALLAQVFLQTRRINDTEDHKVKNIIVHQFY